MKDIVVIGAGLSGTLLVINLLKQESLEEVRIKWLDRNGEQNLGSAYSTNEDYLLNVPVEKMGALANQPEHFLNWCKANNYPAEKGDYLPRKLYRTYIHGILQNEISNKKNTKTLERIKCEALDINIDNNKATVSIGGSEKITANKVILALGLPLPKNPDIKNQLFLTDQRYKQNPWLPDIFDNLSVNDTLFFIGTGQTTVDLLTGLYKKKHKGKMVALSRRGYFPLSQKIIDPYPSFYNELRNLSDILSVLRVVRKHIKSAKEIGLDPRAVIDSLRPDTREIWMRFPQEEKLRFLRHAFRYWEIIRSRIPPASEKIVNELIQSGQLKVLSGKITDIIGAENLLEINYIERGSNIEKTESANFLINCMGPNLDYEKIDQTLIKNLLKKRLIQCDPVRQGINALPDGRVLTEDGIKSDFLFTIGAPLKGILWESIAAPDIRNDAENLAKILLLDQ